MCNSSRVASVIHLVALTACLLSPAAASAQSGDSWTGTLSPLYFWAPTIDGEIATRAGTTPLFLSFDDAVDHLGGAFSFHVEAAKGRVGLFSDLNFVRLSTEADFTLSGPAAVRVNGDINLDNTFFEAGASYLVNEARNLAVIGGLRTYTVSTDVEFSTSNAAVTPIDVSRTAVSGFAGVTFRPALSAKLNLLSRADIGGGSGMSWSALLGFEFRPKPWAGLVLGYKGAGVSFGKDADDRELRRVDLTYYGPILGLNFHWGR